MSDVICTAGPQDRPFEEQHSNVRIAIVLAGSFQYRSDAGRVLMTPGSLLLGNAGQYFECGHEHAPGDRCISFSYDPKYFEDLVAGCSRRPSTFLARPANGRSGYFRVLRVPPLRDTSALVARACATLGNRDNAGWEELSIELAARALELASDGARRSTHAQPSSEARVTRIVRRIEKQPAGAHELGDLAREAQLSRYHFLRVFRHLTGLTPHQYILRARLRRAATQVLLDASRVLDIALDCGFGDLSNFNHAFRAEFGMSPRRYREERCDSHRRGSEHAEKNSLWSAEGRR